MRGSNESRTSRARRLRRGQTNAERRLWHRISNRQLAGYKFVRQEPIGPYIADFVCREHRLIIEVDGSQHADSEHDQIRDAYLKSLGYSVVRFWNHEVMRDMEGVLQTIIAALPMPLPAMRGEGSRRERACAAGEGEGASQDRAHTDAPPHPRSPSVRSASSTALSPPAGRGE